MTNSSPYKSEKSDKEVIYNGHCRIQRDKPRTIAMLIEKRKCMHLHQFQGRGKTMHKSCEAKKGWNWIKNSNSCTDTYPAPPVLTLTGENPMIVLENSDFTDPGATAMDDEEGNMTSKIVVSGIVDTDEPGIWYIITYTVTDDMGKSDTKRRRVYVDKIPIITIIGNNPLILRKGGKFINGDTYIDPGATADDLEDGDITSKLVDDITTVVDFNTSGDYITTYTVTDSAGNVATETRVIRIDEPPVLSLNKSVEEENLGHLLIRLDVSGNFAIDPFVDPGADSTDDWDADITWATNPSDATGIQVEIKDSGNNIITTLPSTSGDYTFTYTLTDSVGNSAIPVSRIVRVDEPPVLTLVDDNPLIVRLGGTFHNNSIYVDPGVTATDDWDDDIQTKVPVATSNPTLDLNTSGDYELTYVVTDSAGNNAIPVKRIVRVDEPPVIVLVDADPLIVRQGGTFPNGTQYDDPGATATDKEDNDADLTINVSGTVNTSVVGSYTLTYSVTDSANNTTSITREVIVDGPPTISLIDNNPFEVSKNHAFTEPGAEAIDTEDGDITTSIVYGGTVDTSTIGTYTLTYTVTDSANNTVSVTRTVNVTGSPPTVSLIGSASVTIREGDSYTEQGASGNDPDDGPLTPVITGTVNVNSPGTYILTYTVTDSDGGTDSVTRTVIVDARPTISLSGANPLEISKNTPFVEPGVTAIDPEDGDIFTSIVYGGTVDTSTIGTYTLTYDVTDSVGNAAVTVTRTVNVTGSGPTIVLNGSSVVITRQGEDYTDADAVASDPDDGPLSHTKSYTLDGVSAASVDKDVPGRYIITYTTTDTDGNSASATRTVIVDRPPVLTLTSGLYGTDPYVIPISVSTGDHVVPGFSAVDFEDDAADLSLTYSVNMNNYNPGVEGTYQLDYTATDSAGNVTTISRTVIIAPDNSPVITLLGDNPITIYTTDDWTTSDPGYTITDVEDDVDGLTLTPTITGSVDDTTEGTYILTYDVTDSYGNAATTVTRTVIVKYPLYTASNDNLGANPVMNVIIYNDPTNGTDIWKTEGELAMQLYDRNNETYEYIGNNGVFEGSHAEGQTFQGEWIQSNRYNDDAENWASGTFTGTDRTYIGKFMRIYLAREPGINTRNQPREVVLLGSDSDDFDTQTNTAKVIVSIGNNPSSVSYYSDNEEVLVDMRNTHGSNGTNKIYNFYRLVILKNEFWNIRFDYIVYEDGPLPTWLYTASQEDYNKHVMNVITTDGTSTQHDEWHTFRESYKSNGDVEDDAPLNYYSGAVSPIQGEWIQSNNYRDDVDDDHLEDNTTDQSNTIDEDEAFCAYAMKVTCFGPIEGRPEQISLLSSENDDFDTVASSALNLNSRTLVAEDFDDENAFYIHMYDTQSHPWDDDQKRSIYIWEAPTINANYYRMVVSSIFNGSTEQQLRIKRIEYTSFITANRGSTPKLPNQGDEDSSCVMHLKIMSKDFRKDTADNWNAESQWEMERGGDGNCGYSSQDGSGGGEWFANTDTFNPSNASNVYYNYHSGGTVFGQWIQLNHYHASPFDDAIHCGAYVRLNHSKGNDRKVTRVSVLGSNKDDFDTSPSTAVMLVDNHVIVWDEELVFDCLGNEVAYSGNNNDYKSGLPTDGQIHYTAYIDMNDHTGGVSNHSYFYYRLVFHGIGYQNNGADGAKLHRLVLCDNVSTSYIGLATLTQGNV